MSAVLEIELTLYGQAVQGLSVPIGSTVSWVLHIQDPTTRLPFDLTNGNVQMSLCELDVKGNPRHPSLFSHQGDIQGDPEDGNVNVEWLDGDTAPTDDPLAPGFYGLDVWTTDVDGNRLQSMGTAVIELVGVATLPGDPITPLPEQDPLAQGPKGDPGDPGPQGDPGEQGPTGFGVSLVDVQLYVDPEGDDSNPGTEAEPLQTIQAAWNLMPIGLLKRRIYLSAGTFPVTSAVSGKDVIVAVPAMQGAGGEPVTIIGTPVDSGLGTLTCTASASNSREISATPHVDIFVGAALMFTSGDAAGQRLLIQADDGEKFMLNTSPEVAGGPVVPGDTFIIERPGSVIQNAEGGINFSGGVMALKDVKFDMANGDILVFRDGCQCVCAQNVEASMNGAPFNVTNNAIFSPQSFGKLFNDPSPFDASMAGYCGAYIHGGVLRVNRGGMFGASSGTGASAVFEGASIVLNNNGAIIMDGGGLALIGTDITVQKSLCVISGNELARVISAGSFGDGLAALNGADVDLSAFDISDAAGNGLLADGGAKVAAGDLGGTGNAGLGISIQGGSFVSSDGGETGEALTTITGNDGDLQVGSNDVVAYDDLEGLGGQGETDGAGKPTLNRFTVLGVTITSAGEAPPIQFPDLSAVDPTLYPGQLALETGTRRLAISYGGDWVYCAMEVPL